MKKHSQLPRPFLLLNIPKTGTTYIRKLLMNADLLINANRLGLAGILSTNLKQTAHKVNVKLYLHALCNSGYINCWVHHMLYKNVPSRIQHLPAISVLRETLSWYISRYVYDMNYLGFERSHKLLKTINTALQHKDTALRSHAEFLVEHYLHKEFSVQKWSALSMEGYWQLCRFARQIKFMQFSDRSLLPEELSIGPLGCETLSFLYRNTDHLFQMNREEMYDHFNSGKYRKHLVAGWRPRFSNLREELPALMRDELGYPPEIVEAALAITPAEINVSSSKHKERAWQELEQKPQLRKDILQTEALYTQYLLPLAGTNNLS